MGMKLKNNHITLINQLKLKFHPIENKAQMTWNSQIFVITTVSGQM